MLIKILPHFLSDFWFDHINWYQSLFLGYRFDSFLRILIRISDFSWLFDRNLIAIMITTRNDTELKEFMTDLIRSSVEGLNYVVEANSRALLEVQNNINGILLQQQYLTEDVRKLKGDGNGSRGGQLQYSRLAKVDFPKFSGDDVKGWIYRCQQFFKVDEISDDKKVHLASIHLFDKALVWHQQFLKLHGDDVAWEVYEAAILQRFGLAYEDPMAELKNLKQDGTVQAYQEQFELLPSKVDIAETHAISMFVGGLQPEIEMTVRMFKPKSLADAFSLAKLQESTLVAYKKRYTPVLNTHKSVSTPFVAKTSSYAPKTTLALPPISPTSSSFGKQPLAIAAVPRRQLSQKQIDEKRAKNQCFYCTEKYTPGHRCDGQMYSLEIIAGEGPDHGEGNSSSTEETVSSGDAFDVDRPHISLNALTGTNAY